MGILNRLFGKKSSASREKETAGQGLRKLALTTEASAVNIHPTDEYPRVFALIMDMPVSGEIFSLFASCGGDVSLYSTTDFGIIGGGQHESVRTPAMSWVKMADTIYDQASPTEDIGYAAPGFVRFFLLTFEGLRSVDVKVEEITSPENPLLVLFMAGQMVLGALRQASGG